MTPCEQIQQLDEELLVRARLEAPLRLRLGQVLAHVAASCEYRALGFSSLTGYVLERCERGERWAESSRQVARRLEVLPLLRAALASGDVSWSMAELVARVARPDNESLWWEAARTHTVRQMRQVVREGLAKRTCEWTGAAGVRALGAVGSDKGPPCAEHDGGCSSGDRNGSRGGDARPACVGCDGEGARAGLMSGEGERAPSGEVPGAE